MIFPGGIMYLLFFVLLVILVGFVGAKTGNALFYKNNPNATKKKVGNKKLIVISILTSLTILIMSPGSEIFIAGFVGISDYKAGKYDKAIAEFTKIIKIDPKNDPGYAFRAKAYLAKGEYDEALSDYCRAISLKPNSAKTYYGRAVAYSDLKNYAAAWEDIHQGDALGYKPNTEDLEFLDRLKKASGRDR
jgi:tetratricopeptide (TPR) repeat protein